MSRPLTSSASRHHAAIALAAAALATATVAVALGLGHDISPVASQAPLPPPGAPTAALQGQYARVVTNAHVVRGARAFTVTLPAGSTPATRAARSSTSAAASSASRRLRRSTPSSAAPPPASASPSPARPRSGSPRA